MTDKGKKERRRIKCPFCGATTRRNYTQDKKGGGRTFIAENVRKCPACGSVLIEREAAK